VSLVVLIAFAGYALAVVIVGIVGSGHGSAFWAQIAVVIGLGIAAIWVARWIYRRRAD
jgi:hypothetical protein